MVQFNLRLVCILLDFNSSIAFWYILGVCACARGYTFVCTSDGLSSTYLCNHSSAFFLLFVDLFNDKIVKKEGPVAGLHEQTMRKWHAQTYFYSPDPYTHTPCKMLCNIFGFYQIKGKMTCIWWQLLNSFWMPLSFVANALNVIG